MNKTIIALLAFALLACGRNKPSTPQQTPPIEGPIQLSPGNPHYFYYKGKTLALISSAEHYGSVLNLGFDYKEYLKTLSADGMNYTRIFSGSYFEIAGSSFSIQHNTLAPENGELVTPWAKVPSPSGQMKYDLNKWNGQYFERLHDFMATAAKYDIIVEVTLFSSIYNDNHWDINPQNPANNINIGQPLDRHKAQTLDNGKLLGFQERFVRKMANELNGYDNFFFEIQNEPWSDRPVPVYNIMNKEELKPNDWTFKADFADSTSMAWQKKIASIIVDAESKLGKKHLIAQNYTNFKAPIPVVGTNVSIINFHYAWPEASEWNYQYNKAIGFDESGFAGSNDEVYRRQAWQFMLSGGGLFNNLDYSFYVGHEDGTGANKAPGGGSKALRKQLKALSGFLASFELATLHPDCTSIQKSPGLIPYMLSNAQHAFAIYMRAVGTKKSSLAIKAPDGYYSVQYLNTISGQYSNEQTVTAKDGILNLHFDIPEGELAIKVTRE